MTQYIHTIREQQATLKVFASPSLLKHMQQDASIKQGLHMAQLPGIQGPALLMPDAHQGYGFPIGGVVAADAQTGCISPGGVGFDINCGMRMILTDLDGDQVKKACSALLTNIMKRVPVGMNDSHEIRLNHQQLDEVARKGAQWAVEQGYGSPQDLEYIEQNGAMDEADPNCISPSARRRGKNQLGTLGSGNHFIEIQRIEKIYDDHTAKQMGLKPDQIVIMIHCGSRGYGHQTCADYIRAIENAYPDIVDSLPDRDLAYAPINSTIGQHYYKAMCCAMNYAWANRQIIHAQISRVIAQMFPGSSTKLLYDMSHNNATKEHHHIDGEIKHVLVHRKGAARAFGPHHPWLPKTYQITGQPVLIPGSMGSPSYILCGTQKGMEESLGTTCHGAGRQLSRKKASQLFSQQQITEQLNNQGITLLSSGRITDEAPQAYKDIDKVIDVCVKTGIARTIARLTPIGVIKG